MDQDLKAARKLQHVLQPREAPELRGLEIALRARPAREISGDVYDFFDHGDDYAVIVFGDVSGKGRGRGSVRRAGQRVVAHSGAAPPQSRGADAVAERNSAGAKSGRAVRDAHRFVVGAADSAG